MNSSHDTDMYSQPSQFRPVTYQPGPARIYQNPTLESSNVAHPAPPPPQLQAPPSRPHSIGELAERAKQILGEDPKPDAKSFQEQGDLESAFVEYAKAATIVLEKIPAHPDYRVLLSTTQRHNMGLHGQEILDSLADIKVSIMTRYEQWRVNPSSVPPQAPASHPVLQPLVAHRSINSHGTNTPTSSSTPSSSRSRASISLRSRTPSPARRERVDALLREDPRRREDVYPADGARADQWHARGDDARQRHEWEEEGRRRVAEQRRLEQEGILRRQREAEHAAQAARFGQPNGQNQGVTGPVMPVSSPVQYPSISASVTTASAPSGPITGYLQMPLESPTRPRQDKPNKGPIQPITTTSPLPPQLGTIQYPSLMTQHQISQGYHPSLGSMFHRPSHTSHSALLFQTPESAPHPHHQIYQQHAPNKSQTPHAAYTAGPGARPPLPPKEMIALAPSPGGSDPVGGSSTRNRETCGLLLGKDKEGRFVVTTLLIPKQHSTSDTCTMDEEELVMQFTEERSLITLGWIHTHPTQSCEFMSSVDLHTHSGFQRMLPESFAVVCAPHSTPNFGIFRLTDPPGLQTILDCHAKEAFHPHSERPIYTDADKGHVQIRDLPLEIVDLR
ncbi:hypothetical protein BGY98DRAFT_1044115 [Russula aff. rugulosa BPL654]|nr:hypothetical protein BGY98DRAFT_1044115 [Russula aff. rugulosa BPL654]